MHREKICGKTCIKLLDENGCVLRLTRLVYRYMWASNLRITERFHERHKAMGIWKMASPRKKTIPEYLQLFLGSRIHKHPLSEIRSNKWNCATFCRCCRKKNSMSEWFAEWLLLFFISGKNSQRSCFFCNNIFLRWKIH